MFLDPALEPVDVISMYSKKIRSFSEVMEKWNYDKKQQKVIATDARNLPLDENSVGLTICHPPYYNLYKYSSIFKFETLWLGLEYNGIKKQEVREGFKMGSRILGRGRTLGNRLPTRDKLTDCDAPELRNFHGAKLRRIGSWEN